jgi:hypothetical protein
MHPFLRKNFEKLRENGFLAIAYALLIEATTLLLLSFAALFTLETILPGLVSGRFVIGKIIIVATLLIFLSASLGRTLGISFPLASSRFLTATLTGIGVWTLAILAISLLSFPLWSIPLFLISFGTIGYFFWRELEP